MIFEGRPLETFWWNCTFYNKVIWEITCEKGAGKSIGSTTHRHSIPFMMDMNICAQLFLRFAGKDGDERKWTECSPLILGKEKGQRLFGNQLNKKKGTFFNSFSKRNLIQDGAKHHRCFQI